MRLRLVAVPAVLLALPAAGASSGDDWFGSDKPRHFGACVFFSGVGYGAGAVLFEPPAARWITGAGLGLGVGVGKELYDLARGSVFSFKDLAWDAAGTATGLLAAFLVDRFITELGGSHDGAPSGRVALGRGGAGGLGGGGGRGGARAALDELDEQLALRARVHEEHPALRILGVGDEHGDLPARALLHAAGGDDADLLGQASAGELAPEPVRQVSSAAPRVPRHALAADEHLHLLLAPAAARFVPHPFSVDSDVVPAAPGLVLRADTPLRPRGAEEGR